MATPTVLIWIVRIVEWSVIGYLGLFLYKVFKFPSLPWVGAYFLAHWVPKILMPFIMAIFFKTMMFRDDILNASNNITKDSLPKAQAVIQIADWTALIGTTSYLLLTLLVMSDMIHIIRSKTKIQMPKPLELVLPIRKNVTLVGTSVVLITLCSHILSTVALYKMFF